MTTETRTKKTPYRLTWNVYGDAQEYISKLEDLVKDPLDNMQQMEGDIYMSDYRNLMQAFYIIQNKDE